MYHTTLKSALILQEADAVFVDVLVRVWTARRLGGVLVINWYSTINVNVDITRSRHAVGTVLVHYDVFVTLGRDIVGAALVNDDEIVTRSRHSVGVVLAHVDVFVCVAAMGCSCGLSTSTSTSYRSLGATASITRTMSDSVLVHVHVVMHVATLGSCGTSMSISAIGASVARSQEAVSAVLVHDDAVVAILSGRGHVGVLNTIQCFLTGRKYDVGSVIRDCIV